MSSGTASRGRIETVLSGNDTHSRPPDLAAHSQGLGSSIYLQVEEHLLSFVIERIELHNRRGIVCTRCHFHGTIRPRTVPGKHSYLSLGLRPSDDFNQLATAGVDVALFHLSSLERRNVGHFRARARSLYDDHHIPKSLCGVVPYLHAVFPIGRVQPSDGIRVVLQRPKASRRIHRLKNNRKRSDGLFWTCAT